MDSEGERGEGGERQRESNREMREDTHKKTEALIFARGPALVLATDSLSNLFALSLLLALSSAVSRIKWLLELLDVLVLCVEGNVHVCVCVCACHCV